MDKPIKKESSEVPCRLHAIVADKADIAVVFRRGPSHWWNILKWNLKTYELESGAWVKGTLYPRRAAISPDGKLLCYFMFKGDSCDTKWNTFFAVSKIPWVTALVAWSTYGTWTTGCWFDRNSDLNIAGSMSEKAFHGKYSGKVNINPPARIDWGKPQYIQEQTTGWKFIYDKWVSENRQYLISALPSDKQMWLRPPIGLMKRRGDDEAILMQLDFGYQFARHEVEGVHAIESRMSDYILRYASGHLAHLSNLRWADWDNHGNLITATWDGCLCVYKVNEDDTLKCITRHDLNQMEPEPTKSPANARKW